jgi:hypothetical protein
VRLLETGRDHPIAQPALQRSQVPIDAALTAQRVGRLYLNCSELAQPGSISSLALSA